jgi:hypothetical protein
MTEDTKLDGRSDVVLNLEREELYELMLMAHEQDITLNQLVEQILQQYIDEYKKTAEDANENLDQ